MKKIILTLLIGLQSTAMAWVSSNPISKKYQFNFQSKSGSFSIEIQEGSYEEAYQKAAQNCLGRLSKKGSMSEDEKLDLVDTCANPHSL
jgi:hypothetical protein